MAQPLHADRALPAVGALALPAVAALTALALALRLVLVRDSLLGDELIMYDIVHGHGLGDVLHVVRETEKTPPLHFVLAWLGAQVVDPRLGIRLASVLAGTALVPLAYLLGRRTVGRAAGLTGAAIVALQPYSMFYGSEARAYALVAAFSALSTLCLLRALETGSRWRWAAYVVAVLGAVYTHYVAFFVLLAQVAWAFWVHRERLRELIVANAFVVLGFLPWLPSYLLQQSHSGDEARRVALLAPPSAGYFLRVLGQVTFGQPFVSLRALPSRGLLVVALVVLGIALVAVALRFGRARTRPPAGVALVLLLALATPVGIALISLPPDHSFLLPRNMIASLVPIALLFGWLVTSLPRPASIAAVTVLLAVLAADASRALDRHNRRSAYRDAAEWIDTHAQPRDPVVEVFFFGDKGALANVLALNFATPHRIFHQGTAAEDAAWRQGRATGRVVWVEPLPSVFKRIRHLPRRAGPGRSFRLVAERRWVGIEDMLAGIYVPR